MYQFLLGSISSETTYTALTNLTIRLVLKHPATVSTGNIFRIPCVSSDDADFIISYGTNVLLIQTTADRHEDPAIFSIPVTANALDDIAIAMNPNTLNTPVVYKNGSAATVTTVDSGTVAGQMATDIWYIGEGTTNIGYVGGVGVWNSQMGTTAMQLMTQARRYYSPLWIKPSNFVEFIRMDDFPVGEFTAYGDDLLPDADVANTFYSGNYTNLQAEDASYLRANKSDDNETYTCSFETATIPSGYSVFGFTTTLKGYTDDTAQCTHKLTLGGGSVLTTHTSTFTGSNGYNIVTDYTTATQSDVDGLKGSLITPSMGKDDDLYWDLYKVKVCRRTHATLTASGTLWRSLPTCVQSVGLSAPGWTL